VPALFSFTIGTGALTGNSIPLEGNPLDVAFVCTSQTSWTAIVSVDNVHKPGSTTEIQDDKVSKRLMVPGRGSNTNVHSQSVSPLQYILKGADGQWRKDDQMGEVLNFFAEAGSRLDPDASDGPGLGAGDDKAVRDMLYHVENLRKRPGAED
jgi:tRNA (guanine-N(7)-)-methyltransferase subunit TRM82